MTDQEAFTQMVNHLRTQKVRCGDKRCWYRGKGKYKGLKCAVGALIPDDVYDPKFDNVDYDLKSVMHSVPDLEGVSYNLLSRMQYIHDSISSRKWEKAWKNVAEFYNLIVPKKGK